MRKKLTSIGICLTALVLALCMACGCSFIAKPSGVTTTTANDSLIAAQSVDFNTTEKTRDIEDAFVTAVAQVKRTSVMLKTESGSAGSGVIVDMSFDGEDAAAWKKDANMVYIVTCHHMISETDTLGTKSVGKITVYLPDEDCSYENEDYIFQGYIGDKKPSEYTSENYAVTLVGGDYESDIALLRLNLNIPAESGNKLSVENVVKAQIPYSTVTEQYRVQLGETVFSIGNPTGTMPGSVARGVVSYLARKTSVSDIGSMTLMQIDVSTNPGSSGGGLYNLYGELIGITNAGNTEYTNINFAIPCYLENGNGFVEIVEQLGGTATDTNYGYVSGRKVKFGFSIAQATDNGSSYVYVKEVISGGIAATNDLKQGDEVLSVSVSRNSEVIKNKDITTVADFASVMEELVAGDKLTINVKRTEARGWRVTTTNTSVEMITESFLFCNTGE